VKVFVTGGNGFVGSHLIEALRRNGDEVAALVRSESKANAVEALGAEPVQGDLGDESVLARAVRGRDAIFHVAGLVKARHEREFLAVNRDGTRRLVRAAERAGVDRFVLVSSLAAGGPAEPGERKSCDEPARPVTPYGRSKLAGEQAVRESALRWTVVRPPAVYGPRDAEFLRLFRIARAGWAPVFGDGDQQLSAVYGPDLAEALRAAWLSETTVGRTYCACHPEVFTTAELARAVGAAMGREEIRVIRLSRGLSRVVLSVTGLAARALGRATVLDSSKTHEFFAPAWTGDPEPLERDAGWRASHDLRAGLEATAAWYRAAGWL
jgi:nucleoside-diphosphate-sugar epimerase